MRYYTIHAPRRPWASLEASVEEARAVKDGFSWPAFVFSFVWALWHRLWLVAAAIFVAEFAVGMLVGLIGFGGFVNTVVSLGMALVVGWLANDLLRDHLERRGLTDLGVVMAGSGEDAIERYFGDNTSRDSYGLPGGGLPGGGSLGGPPGGSSFNGRRPL
jgi:hypothetical protein